MKQDPPTQPIGEEAFEQLIEWLDGPLNTSVERLLKNKILLAACGIGLTTSSKIIASMKRTPLAPWIPSEFWNRFSR